MELVTDRGHISGVELVTDRGHVSGVELVTDRGHVSGVALVTIRGHISGVELVTDRMNVSGVEFSSVLKEGETRVGVYHVLDKSQEVLRKYGRACTSTEDVDEARRLVVTTRHQSVINTWSLTEF